MGGDRRFSPPLNTFCLGYTNNDFRNIKPETLSSAHKHFFSKEPAKSFYFANLEEILHRAHLRGNPIYTPWFFKEDGKSITGSSIIKIILGILFEGFLNSILSVSGLKSEGVSFFQQ